MSTLRTRLVPTIPIVALLSLPLPTPASAGELALPVALDGHPVDAALLASLSHELARPVEPVDACDAPCLTILVGDASATVAFTPAAGPRRARTIALPADQAARRDALVLLAGNLVRDEAADLLASLAPATEPPPRVVTVAPGAAIVALPAAAPASAPAAPAADVTVLLDAPSPAYAPVAFGLIPPLSSDLFGERRRHGVSIDLVAGVSGGSDVLSVSGAVDVELGAVSGAQVGGAITIAREIRGAQVGGAVAVARHVGGAQIGGAIAAAREVRGGQVAGAVNVAGDVAGGQVAGAVNVADEVSGAQVAGAINVADDVDGVQVAGAINVARRARLQIGVVNVSGDPDTIALGVLNLVRGGRTDVEASIDVDAVGAVLLRHGGRRWHNVYGVAGRRGGDAAPGMPGVGEDVWMYGLGFGPSWTTGRRTIDVEAMAWQVNHGARHSRDLSLLSQLRASLAWELGGASVVVGAAANVYVSTRPGAADVVFRATGDLDDPPDRPRVQIWPTVFVGVRL